CTSSPSSGLENGGVFTVGVTTISCSVANSCGVVGACVFDVEVTPFNELIVDVQLSPVMVDGPLTRCITFDLFQQCGGVTGSVSQEITFGAPLDLPGKATGISVLIPAGAWECITARDRLHTLRSTAEDFVINGTVFEATFVSNPALGGQLTGGNLNDDGVIDIVDFGTWHGQLGLSFPDTDCSVPSPHADINGDGIVDAVDFTFILANFFAESQPNCCDVPSPLIDGGRARGRRSVSIRELTAEGLGHLRASDLNNDGRLDMADVELAMEQMNVDR
ncbi:MAG: hypothetical protein IID36_14450, partial [Planctomycetes bacterium]|nr:hypothetical protein [Planctomycetota bacterium]